MTLMAHSTGLRRGTMNLYTPEERVATTEFLMPKRISWAALNMINVRVRFLLFG